MSRHKFSPLDKFHGIHKSRRYTSDWLSVCLPNAVRQKISLELSRRCLKGPKLRTDFKRKQTQFKKKVDAGRKSWYSSVVAVQCSCCVSVVVSFSAKAVKLQNMLFVRAVEWN